MPTRAVVEVGASRDMFRESRRVNLEVEQPEIAPVSCKKRPSHGASLFDGWTGREAALATAFYPLHLWQPSAAKHCNSLAVGLEHDRFSSAGAVAHHCQIVSALD